ncbi:MAG: hypothetical protein R3F49_18820 [Planctomycetota bacterium]
MQLHALSLLALTSAAAFGQSALYDAGTAGNPAVAPDPTTQGWTLVDPSAGAVTFTPISPDPGTGLNAWQVDDQATFNGGRAHYAQYFTAGELATAADLGWELTLEARFLASAGVDLFNEFATGTAASDDRYLLFYEVAGSDVTVNVFLAGAVYVCTGGNDGSYHTYTIRKPAGAGVLDAEFLFDGVVLGPLPRAASNANAAPGGIHWGSGSSGATGTANFHRVEFELLGPVPLGTAYCTAAPNSTGSAASLGATGSAIATQNNVTLTCTQMPPNAFSFFLTSATQGFVASPGGSQGNLCLGGSIGRYVAPGQIQNSGAAGAVALALDLTQHPTPNGLISVVAGQSWNFQCWYRDANPTVTSNFSSGLQIDFL